MTQTELLSQLKSHYAQGLTLPEIADKLNAQKALGREWTMQQVSAWAVERGLRKRAKLSAPRRGSKASTTNSVQQEIMDIMTSNLSDGLKLKTIKLIVN